MQVSEDKKSLALKVESLVKAKPRETVVDIYDKQIKKFLKYTFKDYVKSLNSFTYRCASRSDCSFQIRLSLNENFISDGESSTVKFYKLKDESQQISWLPQDNNKKHTCKFQIEEEKQQTEVRTFQKDRKVLENYVRRNPLASASKLKYELDQQRQVFTKEEINVELRRIRAEKYPQDTFLVFTPEYCKSLDDPKQNPFCCYMKTPTRNDEKEYSEILILATQFQLARLSQSAEWYIDGTFWSCPSNFYQMLNVMVFSPEVGKSICVAHLLVGSKKPEEYITAFINLLVIANNSKILLSPKFIMTDFESGLRSALKWVFPKATLLGCQFHFVKHYGKKQVN